MTIKLWDTLDWTKSAKQVERENIERYQTYPVDSGAVAKGRIGVGIIDIDERVSRRLDLPNADGVLLVGVAPGGPAADGGMAAYDYIVNIGEKRIRNTNELQYYVGSLRPGKSVKVKFYREGKVKTVTLKIAAAR